MNGKVQAQAMISKSGPQAKVLKFRKKPINIAIIAHSIKVKPVLSVPKLPHKSHLTVT
uniref:hypothetical protein n=1 Tax=Polynucleobacter sp. TaxID=2029855 RepID=UPI004048A606